MPIAKTLIRWTVHYLGIVFLQITSEHCSVQADFLFSTGKSPANESIAARTFDYLKTGQRPYFVLTCGLIAAQAIVDPRSN
jgi:hypothetical protein